MNKKYILPVFILLLSVLSDRIFAQENYEIQIYPSETIGAGNTMVEIHSNYTFSGQPASEGVRPTQHAFHETLELTHGFTSFFEIGFYQFTNIQKDFGFQWVGSHLRPRISIPESYNWPVGLSFSTEIGYQNREYSTDTWTLEIRPVFDKDFRLCFI
jgi:hypothetical protein